MLSIEKRPWKSGAENFTKLLPPSIIRCDIVSFNKSNCLRIFRINFNQMKLKNNVDSTILPDRECLIVLWIFGWF